MEDGYQYCETEVVLDCRAEWWKFAGEKEGNCIKAEEKKKEIMPKKKEEEKEKTIL